VNMLLRANLPSPGVVSLWVVVDWSIQMCCWYDGYYFPPTGNVISCSK